MLSWLNGKKTTISAIAWPILTMVTGQGWVGPEVAKIAEIVLGMFTAGALGHKAYKAKK